VRRALILTGLVLWSSAAGAREAVEATVPTAVAVTLYRDPNRDAQQPMNREWPQGFAMISETRQVTLPPGESTVRFTGVAEGMVAVSAIVTGLPGGTIEKNRNADLLSPASLIDGTLGNQVTITRTNPATGDAVSERAIVRTRADGGLVLQTSAGFEAVRCSGLPEKLTFDRVPDGLSAQPVFSIDTQDARGGTYTVQLTYIAWGFDWQAHYVATLAEPRRDDRVRMRLVSWLTLLNDNGQSFRDAELLVVAGRLNVTSDYRSLSDPPDARPLELTCFPIGSTAEGTAINYPAPPPPSAPPPPPMPVMAQSIVVTGSRAMRQDFAVKAVEEQLGDLKLYRVPEPVTVAAKSLKQVAFLDQDAVEGRLLYRATCSPGERRGDVVPAAMLLVTVNDKRHGLGMALPQGGITVFEPSPAGDLLVGEESLRDYAEGQDVELAVGTSTQVFALCERPGIIEPNETPVRWTPARVTLTNGGPAAATVRVVLGASGEWQLRGLGGTRIKDGEVVAEVTVPGNGRRVVEWEVRPAGAG